MATDFSIYTMPPPSFVIDDLGDKTHPSSTGVHVSDAVDFGYVISGEMWLEFDGGSQMLLHTGDTFVQNGTYHVWHKRATEPCTL